jgi:hypothetical protein
MNGSGSAAIFWTECHSRRQPLRYRASSAVSEAEKDFTVLGKLRPTGALRGGLGPE